MSSTGPTPHVVVVGAGMVAHRFVESLLSRAGDAWRVTVIGDEQRHPYDRVGLTSYFAGASVDDLSLDAGPLADERVTFLRGTRATRVDTADAVVLTDRGERIAYDRLVLATGSYAARLAVDGYDNDGCFVYRTLDDVEALEAFVNRRSAELGRPLVGTVIGGGLLGLEAAGALQGLGVDCTVVQSSDRLMSAQLDLPAGDALRR
ncbi:MAG TPA: nitrite reductase (NAD(P)H), partial [Microbacterium sp.]|nr:nitrite reductase (NAD(P)H) [Microbacterium sp.]